MFSFFVTHTSKCFLVKEACSCNWDFRFFTTQKKTAIVWSKEFMKTIKSTMIGWEIRIDSSREKHKDCNHWMDMSGPKLQERGKKNTLLVCRWRHGGNVGGQEQKHFSSLGTKLYFHVNASRKKILSYWPPNMAALSRGCKPRIRIIYHQDQDFEGQ